VILSYCQIEGEGWHKIMIKPQEKQINAEFCSVNLERVVSAETVGR
jgi:hypothetical protein